MALVAVIMGSVTSCRTARKAVVPAGEELATAWHDVYLPVKVSLLQPASMSLSGRATMVRDSAVFVSMRVLGMEVATLYADRDSVIVLDKFHKYVYSEPLSAVTSRAGLTLGDIQEILLGRQELPFSDDRVSVKFSEPVVTEIGPVSPSVTVSAELGRKSVKAAIEWSVGKARWNAYRPITCSSPKGYTRLSRDNILEILKF